MAHAFFILTAEEPQADLVDLGMGVDVDHRAIRAVHTSPVGVAVGIASKHTTTAITATVSASGKSKQELFVFLWKRPRRAGGGSPDPITLHNSARHVPLRSYLFLSHKKQSRSPFRESKQASLQLQDLTTVRCWGLWLGSSGIADLLNKVRFRQEASQILSSQSFLWAL